MFASLQQALDEFPAGGRALLEQQLKQFDGRLPLPAVNQLLQQTGLNADALTLALLPVAAAFSVAPLSHFHVGAIATGADGDLYLGANYEFVGLPLNHSLHAEQSAISNAWQHGEQRLAGLTINTSPCGHCRQFINELPDAAELPIHLPHQQYRLSQLLPEAFGPGNLGIRRRLLQDQPVSLGIDSDDPLVKAAAKAAGLSHSPYTGALAGVALLCSDDLIVSGRYAENAAFNPSLMPMQMALNQLNLCQHSPELILRAVLVELDDAPVDLYRASCDALASVTDLPLERHLGCD